MQLKTTRWASYRPEMAPTDQSWNRKRRRRLLTGGSDHLLTSSPVPINHQVANVMPSLKSICAILFLLSNLLFIIAINAAESDNKSIEPIVQQAQQVSATPTISGSTFDRPPPPQQTTQESSSSSPPPPPTTTTTTIRETTTSISAALVSSANAAATTAASSQASSTTTTTRASQTTQAKRDLTSTTSARSQQQQLERDATARANRRSGNVCQVNDGESVAILEIEESRGSDTSQRTSPGELPISGSVSSGEIELKIESEAHKYFQVQDKSLRLIRPLDRDATLRENSTQIAQQPITSIYLQVSCTDKRLTPGRGPSKKVIIPVLVKVLDLNDNAPKFSQPSYAIEVNELAPVGTIVMDQFAFAIDLDSASNGQVEYSLLGVGESGEQQSFATTSKLATTTTLAPAKPLAGVTTNQRLVQRAPLESSGGSTPRPAAATTAASTTTTTTTVGGVDSTTGSGNPSSQAATVELSETSTGAPPSGSDTNEDMMQSTSPPGAVQLNAKPSGSSGPTINLDSEPILNGPMEEPDEDESDEALLASMNSGGNNSSDTDSELSAFASSLGARARSLFSLAVASVDKQQRRKRRHTHPDSAQPPSPMTTTSDTMRKQLPLTTTTPNRPVDAPRSAPWTNLMMISNEDLRTLDDGHAPTATTRIGVGGDLGFSGSMSGFHQPLAMNSNDYFALELAPQSNRPVLRLKRPLDYETQRVHQLTLVAMDRAPNKRDRLTSQARITIRVLDGDDQSPAFVLDQVGCATNSLPRTTTPLPPGRTAGLPTTSKQPQAVPADPLAPAASSSSSNSNNNLQLRSFMVTDENFDFGDTLGLDDTPLDEDTGAGGGVTMVVGPAGGAGRTRRVPETKPTGVLGSLRAAIPTSSANADYSCLPSASSSANVNSQAEYFATVVSGDSDYLLRVLPQAIKARDRDELNAPIRYSLVEEGSVPSNFSQYFQINPLDATIKQVAPVERSQVSEFTLMVKAQEQSYNRLFSVAKLTIDVLPTDKNPPVLAPNSYSGYVDENSPLGTRVFVSRPPTGSELNSSSSTAHLRIAVLDSDASGQQQKFNSGREPGQTKPKVQFEFETTSDAFKVDREGYLYVNRFPLDRDSATPVEAAGQPSQSGQGVHTFQVTAHQVGLVSSRSVSSPVSLNITLGDLNDNPPQLLNSSLVPVTLAANSQASGAQQLVRLQALDRDLPENGQMHFSIQHVSNGGSSRFRIDEDSGRIEALGRFVAGEQFSLSVQVADDLGRASQGILEVRVVPGANTGPPQFLAPDFAVSAGGGEAEGRDSGSRASGSIGNYLLHQPIEVNEAVSAGSVVTQVRAQDPENDPIAYSIIGGNTNGDFSINSRTGSLVVANKLDREEISAYRLVVQARDSGGLATSRTLHIHVTDANDQNPMFTQGHYVFAIEEGVPAVSGAEATNLPLTLGRVLAQDSDEGDNGRVSYSLMVLAEGAAPYAAAAAAGREPSRTTNEHVTPSGTAKTSEPGQFTIDEQTGEIKLNRPLDYERARGHTLMVVARDHGESPRSSSAMIQVKVLDRQDELPYFELAHLEVRVDENAPAGQRVAHIQARDPDSVAQVTYVLLSGDPDNLFQVDPQTGQLTTGSGRLDYEQARSHSLIIGTNESLAALGQEALTGVARQLNEHLAAPKTDHQPPPAAAAQRWLVMRVDVHVNDLNDNVPQFESAGAPLLPVRVQDSLAPGSVLDAVNLRARDADGSAPNNQVKYELVTARTSADDQETGTLPMFTSDRCARLFLVDPATCKVSVRQDLRTSDGTAGGQAVSECQLVIRARDTPLGEATPLSSLVTLTVYIDHLAEISPSSMLAFADTSYTLELAENAPANTLVRVLPVINKPKSATQGMPPMSCEIVSGNELNRFYVAENEQRDCELKTRDHLLDYEQRQRFLLAVRLNTFGGVAGQRQATLTRVQINVLDRNDNRPVFAEPPSRYGHLTQNRYLAALARDAPPETQVAQLRASDADSPQANGLISYELFSGAQQVAPQEQVDFEHQSQQTEGSGTAVSATMSDPLESRFRVDPIDGILRTSKPIEDIPATRLPLRLRVVARDNPEQASDALETTAELVVNLIEDQHRLVLVLRDTPPSRVLDAKDQLLGVLQERTGLISGLERVESMRVQRNASLIETDVGGTDVWFYLVEPGSLRLITSDDPRLKSALFEGRAQNSLADILAQSLALTSGSRARVRLPYALTNALNSAGTSTSGPASLFFAAFRADSRDRLAPALILIALFIAIASAIVVIYQCGSVAGWSESSAQQQQVAATGQQHTLPPGFLPHPFGGHPALMPQPQQQQQHFSKEKFLFSQPPPPSAAASLGQYQYSGSQLGDTLGHHAHNRLSDQCATGPGTRSSFTSGNGYQQHHNYQGPLGPEVAGATMLNESQAKEYETQMLKMSVLFDDSQSFVERESAAPTDYGDNKNLV